MELVRDAGTSGEYISFLESHPRGHFLQLPEWAQVKSGWRGEQIVSRGGDGAIRGGMSLLIRRLPVFGDLAYCPRGPVCGHDDMDAMAELTDGCRELMGRYGAFVVRAEPDFPEGDEVFRACMESLGWRFRPCRDAFDTVQPRSLFRLRLSGRTEEEIFAGFHKKLRYNIRLALRRGVYVEEGRREDLAALSALMDVTARRDGFLGRGLAYFQRFWDCLGPGRVSLLLAKLDGRCLAAGLFVSFAGRTWYSYGASADEGREAMPSHLLQWEAIRRALRRGDRVYDLRGFLERGEEDPSGLYRFKKQFGGDLVRLVGEMYLTPRPRLYALERRVERGWRRLAPARERLRR